MAKAKLTKEEREIAKLKAKVAKLEADNFNRVKQCEMMRVALQKAGVPLPYLPTTAALLTAAATMDIGELGRHFSMPEYSIKMMLERRASEFVRDIDELDWKWQVSIIRYSKAVYAETMKTGLWKRLHPQTIKTFSRTRERWRHLKAVEKVAQRSRDRFERKLIRTMVSMIEETNANELPISSVAERMGTDEKLIVRHLNSLKLRGRFYDPLPKPYQSKTLSEILGEAAQRSCDRFPGLRVVGEERIH
jgi:hypothetical protein